MAVSRFLLSIRASVGGVQEFDKIWVFLLSASDARAGQATRGPRGLQIEAARKAVHIQNFSGKKETFADFRFHGFGMNLGERHAAGGDKFISGAALDYVQGNGLEPPDVST